MIKLDQAPRTPSLMIQQIQQYFSLRSRPEGSERPFGKWSCLDLRALRH